MREVALRIGPRVGGAGACDGALAGLVFTGEETAAQWAPDDDPQAFELADGYLDAQGEAFVKLLEDWQGV